MVAMLAGANFIKTSTGKEAVNATLPVGLVMCRAIRYFYQMKGVKVCIIQMNLHRLQLSRNR